MPPTGGKWIDGGERYSRVYPRVAIGDPCQTNLFSDTDYTVEWKDCLKVSGEAAMVRNKQAYFYP